jgi:hypothetical protein
MYVTRWVAAAAVCALVTAPAAFAQQPAKAPDAAKLPPPAAKYEGVWPKTLPQPGAAGQAPPPALARWSEQDIELARARCAVLLKGLDLVAVPAAPMSEGKECGTAAPMQLVSIGSNPQISLSPPPLLTCDMIAALHAWLQKDVQPLARKHLGAPLVGVATMSSYSCRNAYGRARTRLSEHGRVNALDIAGFTTAKGVTAAVVADWGPIAREIAAAAAAAAAAHAQAEADKKKSEAAGKDAQQEKAAPVAPQAPAITPLRPSIAIPPPKIVIPPPPGLATGSLGLADPSRLGGPKAASGAQPAPADGLGGKAQFLRAVHRAACKTFGTVLGPEANHAHKNHFHLDMAERRHGTICE